jgi:hypothetical protein
MFMSTFVPVPQMYLTHVLTDRLNAALFAWGDATFPRFRFAHVQGMVLGIQMRDIGILHPGGSPTR